MASKHALITGGAGFIGSHLADLLMLEHGWQVTVLDDLSTGRESNLDNLHGNESFRFVRGSAGDYDLLCSLIDDGVDVVFHLAAAVGVEKVMENTVETIENILHTTECVLRACDRKKTRMLFTSTSEVYGANPNESFSEDDDAIIGPSYHRRWCYAAGKLMDEFHAYGYYHARQLPVTIVRLFNTIGPRQVAHYGMVVPRFIGQALKNEPLTVYGDGQQKRCFTDVKDVVRCLHALVETEKTAGQTYNVGSQNEIAMLDLATRIKEMTGSDSEIVLKSYEEVFGENFDDMRRRVPETKKLREAIGFAPERPLDEILTAAIDALRTKQ